MFGIRFEVGAFFHPAGWTEWSSSLGGKHNKCEVFAGSSLIWGCLDGCLILLTQVIVVLLRPPLGALLKPQDSREVTAVTRQQSLTWQKSVRWEGAVGHWHHPFCVVLLAICMNTWCLTLWDFGTGVGTMVKDQVRLLQKKVQEILLGRTDCEMSLFLNLLTQLFVYTNCLIGQRDIPSLEG